MIFLIFIIIAAIHTFRTARKNGRNPYIWAGVSVAVFFGAQIIVSMGIGIAVFVVAGEEAMYRLIRENAYLFGIFVDIAASAGVLVVLWFVNRSPRDKGGHEVPPHPSFFGLDD